MSPQTGYQGRHRVVIDKVIPSIDCGAFGIRRVIGDSIRVVAHIFADGHDPITAFLRHRKVGQRGWQEMPMKPLGNDEFAVTFRPEEVALHEYTVVAMIDHFVGWFDGFAKKADANQPLEVELQIGSDLVHEAALRASGDDRKNLKAWGDFLADPKRDFAQRVHLARSDDLLKTVLRYPDHRLATTLPEPLVVSVERELAAFGAWYEMFPRSARNDGKTHGTFKDVVARLGDIAHMGFDILYFPPIHPIGRVFRKGRNNSLEPTEDDVGSPWAIGAEEGGHKSILPELGTLDDFKKLIREAERHGLEIAMDIAFQCAPDHPYVKEHPQWFKWRPDGTVQYAENPPKKYQDILPFDFESEDWRSLWDELKSIFEYWIEVGVRVFRVDNPHTKPMEFWRWCIHEIKKKHPDVIFLAEAFTRPKRKYRLAKANFTQGYTYFTWRNHPAEMREYVEELTQTEVKDYFWPNFWPNTPDILHEDLQNGTRATFIGRYVLAATLASNIGIYGPAYELMDHEPFPGKEEYNNNEKYQLKHWNLNAPGNIREEITRVNEIRRANPALQRTGNIQFLETDNASFLACLKQTPDRSNQIIVIVNMDWHWSQMGHIQLPLDSMGLGSDQEIRVQDLLDPTRPVYTWRGSRNFVKLDPARSPAHILRVVR